MRLEWRIGVGRGRGFLRRLTPYVVGEMSRKKSHMLRTAWPWVPSACPESCGRRLDLECCAGPLWGRGIYSCTD